MARLDAGTAAPSFSTTSVDGAPLSLEALRGRPVWLGFYRFANCPLCCVYFLKLISQWEARYGHTDLVHVAVWQSPADRLTDILQRHDPPVTLVSDPHMELYAAYEVEKSVWGAFGKGVWSGMKEARAMGLPMPSAIDGPATRIPADFLLTPDGTIEVARYGSSVADHIPLPEVDAFLDRCGYPVRRAA